MSSLCEKCQASVRSVKGANDVLRVVGENGNERLVPFVSAVVLAVEKEAGQIRVEWGSDW